MAPASSGDSGGSGRVLAVVSGGVSSAAVAWEGRRNVSGGGRYSGDWMLAGNCRAAPAEDQNELGTRDDHACCDGSGVFGCVAISCHGDVAIRTVAADASFDCRTAAARGAEAVLDPERRAGGLAGKDQLQPLFMAAAVCVRKSSSAVVFRFVSDWAGECVLLFGGAADAAIAREESGSKDGECVGGCGLMERPRGLKLFSPVTLYAALKRRSSTVL